jgi:hypothetical protein
MFGAELGLFRQRHRYQGIQVRNPGIEVTRVVQSAKLIVDRSVVIEIAVQLNCVETTHRCIPIHMAAALVCEASHR